MKKSLLNKIINAGGIMAIALFSQISLGQTTVTVVSSATYIGYANVYENTEAEAFVFGQSWGVPELKTDINGNNTLTLYPNFNGYANEVATTPNETFWHIGEMGNKIFEGNTYVQNDELAGQILTFNGGTVSNTLAAGYEAIAFVKVYNADYSQLIQFVNVPLVGGENFSLTTTATEAGQHIQYGFSVKGLNGNPAQMAQLGNAVVGQTITAGLNDITAAKTTVYPNPATSVLNLRSANVIENATIYNVVGQVVVNKNVNASEVALDVASLTSGVYILNTTVNGQQSSTRFVKQ